MNEFGKKCKPKSDDTTAKLIASVPSLAHNSCKKDKGGGGGGGGMKKTRLVHMDSRTTSMLVEVGNSSSSTTDSNSSFHSSFGSLREIRKKVNEPLIEEPGFPDANGNQEMSSEDVCCKHNSWHGNQDVSDGVGHGIFTESPDSSQFFPVFRMLTASSDDDAVEEERTPSESSIEDDKGKEMIPMKKLRRQWSFDGGKCLHVVPPRNCQSVGDLA